MNHCFFSQHLQLPQMFPSVFSVIRRLEMRALPAEDMGKHRAQLKGLEAGPRPKMMGNHYKIH